MLRKEDIGYYNPISEEVLKNANEEERKELVKQYLVYKENFVFKDLGFPKYYSYVDKVANLETYKEMYDRCFKNSNRKEEYYQKFVNTEYKLLLWIEANYKELGKLQPINIDDLI